MKMRRLSLILSASLIAGAANAQSPERPEVEPVPSKFGNALDVASKENPVRAGRPTEALKKLFEGIEESAQPIRAPSQVSKFSRLEWQFTAELFAVVDGSGVFAFPIDAAKKASLAKAGARLVELPSEIGHHTIMKDNYFRVLTIVGAESEIARVSGMIGKRVKVNAMRTEDLNEVIVRAVEE